MVAGFRVLVVVLFVLVLVSFASAATYQCVFKNAGQVNCNAVNAGNTFCYTAGPGPVVNNPAVAASCTNNSPAANGQIVCQLNNYSGSTSSIRCSNSTYFVSGPTLVGASSSTTSGSCSYNDCELNQISCASAYAYQKCVPDSQSSGCNKWEATNCVASAPCYSTTSAQLATCAGVPSASIASEAGVYFYNSSSTGSTGTTGSTSTGTNTTTTTTISTDSYSLNGKNYYIVKSDDSAGDTGTEVCQNLGKQCVGYTATSTSVCTYFYPTASVVSNSVNGSKSPYYCNGAPQKDLACENTYNTCAVCPACNVNIDCDTEIGTQFRAMFVECSGGVEVASTTQTQVLNALGILGNSTVNVIDESTGTHYGVVIQNSTVTSITTGSDLPNANYTVNVKPAALTALANSTDPSTEVVVQMKAGNIIVTANNFVDTIILFFFNIFLMFR
ncbi:MAG: hypothetical protein AABW59_02285 [archaeon]